MRSIFCRSVALLAALAVTCAAPEPENETDDASSHPVSGVAFSASADVRAESDHPSSNFASDDYLEADSSPLVWSYLRFRVTGISKAVKTAKVSLYISDDSANGPAIYGTTGSWTESTVTWKNRPMPAGDPIDNKGKLSKGKWVDYDVSKVVTGNGTFNFALIPDGSDGVKFNSREASSKRPQLVITTVQDAQEQDPGTETLPDASGDPNSPDAASGGENPDPTQNTTAVLVGAGDIADCNSHDDSATALLLDNIEGTIFTAGDNAYETGSSTEFRNCYDATWGRHKDRTWPAVGNHEYKADSKASPYSDYFGEAAGSRGKYYYSKDLGAWHIIILNSMLCEQSGGCDKAQLDWLRQDLQTHASQDCSLAIWHHPRFTSGDHGNDSKLGPLWDVLYAGGADIVLNGHDHDYERFGPQDPSGSKDTAHGIVEFVVGTGGRDLRGFGSKAANSVVRNATSFGVLKLTLRPHGYDFDFIPASGASFTDHGSGACH